MKENDPKKAKEFWEKSLKINPENQIIIKNLKLLSENNV